MNPKDRPKSRRGFAAMSPEMRSHLARMGGKATPPEKRAFSKDHELARTAGAKGGTNTRTRNRIRLRDE